MFDGGLIEVVGSVTEAGIRRSGFDDVSIEELEAQYNEVVRHARKQSNPNDVQIGILMATVRTLQFQRKIYGTLQRIERLLTASDVGKGQR